MLGNGVLFATLLSFKTHLSTDGRTKVIGDWTAANATHWCDSIHCLPAHARTKNTRQRDREGSDLNSELVTADQLNDRAAFV